MGIWLEQGIMWDRWLFEVVGPTGTFLAMGCAGASHVRGSGCTRGVYY